MRRNANELLEDGRSLKEMETTHQRSVLQSEGRLPEMTAANSLNNVEGSVKTSESEGNSKTEIPVLTAESVSEDDITAGVVGRAKSGRSLQKSSAAPATATPGHRKPKQQVPFPAPHQNTMEAFSIDHNGESFVISTKKNRETPLKMAADSGVWQRTISSWIENNGLEAHLFLTIWN